MTEFEKEEKPFKEPIDGVLYAADCGIKNKGQIEKTKKPSEGLEEEIERYIPTSLAVKFPTTDIETIKSDIRYIARHFAKWGAEHCGGSEIPKDLESYAQTVEDYYDVGEEKGYLCTHRGDIKNAVITGAKWQKEQDEKELSEKIASAYQLGLADKEKQMMKEAVDAEVWNYASNEDLRAIPIWGINKFRHLKDGDKVRIIIVKEEGK